LRAEFPELAERIKLRTPDEKDKRHGQAVAAASLPALRKDSAGNDHGLFTVAAEGARRLDEQEARKRD
jgi:hypothetical protein